MAFLLSSSASLRTTAGSSRQTEESVSGSNSDVARRQQQYPCARTPDSDDNEDDIIVSTYENDSPASDDEGVLNLKSSWSHKVLLKLQNTYYKENPTKLYGIETGLNDLSSKIYNKILSIFFFESFHRTPCNACSKFYLLWSSCKDICGNSLGAILCRQCFTKTLKENGVVKKWIENIKPSYAFLIHEHNDGDFHCSWCFKGTLNLKNCELHRCNRSWSAFEVWHTNKVF